MTGQLEGGALSSAATVGWPGGLATATAESVITLTETTRWQESIDENMIEGVARSPQGDGAFFWFNTAQPDGPDVPYRNNYVFADPEAESESGSVRGWMLTAAHCGEQAYWVAVEADELVSGNTSLWHHLYSLTPAEEPKLVGGWQDTADFRPFSKNSVCSPVGDAIYNIYGTVAELRDETGEAELTLVRIDTATGARTATPIEMAGNASASSANTLTLVGDRIYWISADNTVLSVSISGEERTVREEWSVPEPGRRHQVGIAGNVVSLFSYDETPIYSEFNLVTGKPLRDSVEVSGISELLSGSDGGTVLGVISVNSSVTSPTI